MKANSQRGKNRVSIFAKVESTERRKGLFWGCPQVELQIVCLLVIRFENHEQDRFVP